MAKASVDLLTEMFRDTWKFVHMADNVSKRTSFTTLAQQIGDILDVAFRRFMALLDRSGRDRLDAAVFNKTAKAFATFVRNCSFDSGKLKDGYIQAVVVWCQSIITRFPEEALIVLKSLLWTDIKFEPFAKVFDYLFNTFVAFFDHPREEYAKPASFALCRIAYGYPDEMVRRYGKLKPKVDGPFKFL